MSEITRLDQNRRRSRAVVHGSVAYIGGQVADNKTAAIAQQTHEALSKIDSLLDEIGTDKSRLLTAQIWLRSMDDFDGMNAVWDAWIAPGSAPTRCCGEVQLADPDFRVEIVVSAAL